MSKLKLKEKAAYRMALLEGQGGVCALCKKEIREGQATLDHCHSSGHVRMVLCRHCNSTEGRVLHRISRVSCDKVEWLQNLLWYYNQDWTDNPIYPTHKCYIEKQILDLKRKRKRVKKQSTKDNYTRKIDRLKKQLRQEETDERKKSQAVKKSRKNSRTRKRPR